MSTTDTAPAAAVLVDAEGNAFDLRPRTCPTCGVTARRVLGLRGGRHHRYGLGIETRIVRCHRCGLIFPDPFPYPRDAQRLYGDPDKYLAAHDTGDKLASSRLLVARFRRRLGRDAFSLLDVGSGRGEMLAAAQAEGIEAVGLELSQAMIDHAQRTLGVRVLRKTIEEYAAETDRSFDAVALLAVLEHVYDPDAMIAAVRRLTRPGSVLYVDIPREPNLLTIVGNAWNRLRGRRAIYNLQPTWPPYHVYGFDPRSLRILLSKHGFDVLALSIRADPHVIARDDARDRARAFVATQINRVANWTGMASNMYVWARRR
jgi:SAM-dependent methyltransferase